MAKRSTNEIKQISEVEVTFVSEESAVKRAKINHAYDVARDEIIRSQNLPSNTSKMKAAEERNRWVKFDICKSVPGLNEHKVFTVSAQDCACHLGFSASKDPVHS